MMPPSPQSWEGRGLCRTEGHPSWWDDFLDSEGDNMPTEKPAERRARHEKAKEVCRRCPVIDFCAAATDLEQDEGVRFGELIPEFRERKRHRKDATYEIIPSDRWSA